MPYFAKGVACVAGIVGCCYLVMNGHPVWAGFVLVLPFVDIRL